MFIRLFIVLSMIMMFPNFAVAGQAIDGGWWWNPTEPGWGANIELQNDTVFIALFVYTADGTPEWYTGSGKLTGTAATLSRSETTTATATGTLGRYVNGQPMNGAYRAPQAAASPGSFSLTFTSRTAAQLGLFVPGIGTQTRLIERYNFNLGTPPASMLGEWHFSYVIISGWMDRYTFTSTTTAANPEAADGAFRGMTATGGSALGECYVRGLLRGQCLVVSGSDIHWFDAPLNVATGYYRLSGGSGTRYNSVAVRVRARALVTSNEVGGALEAARMQAAVTEAKSGRKEAEDTAAAMLTQNAPVLDPTGADSARTRAEGQLLEKLSAFQ